MDRSRIHCGQPWKFFASVVASLILISRAALAAPGEIENLGTLFGSQQSQAIDINDAGAVVGHARVLRNSILVNHAFVRPAGGGPIQDLAPDIGTTEAHGVNSAGLITGWGDLPSDPPSSGYERAFIRPAAGGPIQNAGVSAGGFSRAFAVNTAGDIAGRIGYFLPAGLQERPFIRMSDGTVHDLGLPLGASNGNATGVNASRDVVGSVFFSGLDRSAFLYRESSGAYELLGALGGTWSEANDINSAGDIVGVAEIAGGQGCAFVRSASDGIMRGLASPAGGFGSAATDISDAGFVVGSIAVGVNHAAFWHTSGALTDLDTWLDLINPDAGQFWTLNVANAINNSGMIVGTGVYNDGVGGLSDGTRGFVLDGSSLIVPEPASLALFIVPAVLTARRRRTLRVDSSH